MSRAVREPSRTGALIRAFAWAFAGITASLAIGACESKGPAAAVDSAAFGSSCLASSSLCGTDCVNLLTDARNCGRCGVACGEGETCESGRCASATSPPATCNEGSITCDGQCVDVRFDAAHCGDCTTRCSNAQRCANGACTVGCAAGTIACGDTCVESNRDPAHCGATTGCGVSGGSAGEACAANAECLGGQCITDCGDGRLACRSGCVDPKTDEGNCGSCGNACKNGQWCSAGFCCATGWTACMGICRHLASDELACGGCGIICSEGQTCESGTCVP